MTSSELIALVESIRRSFPKDAADIDARLQADGWVIDQAPYEWIERFSQRTTDACRRGDTEAFDAHLRLMSSLLKKGNNVVRRCISVAYAEPLLWDVRDERQLRTAWRRIPANLQACYVAVWGKRSFM